MDTEKRGSERGVTPPFVRPFLSALNRMQEDEVLRPSQYVDRARSLLEERLSKTAHPVQASFGKGCVGIIADHTHYFEGFALLLRLQQGIAAAVRFSDRKQSCIVLEGVGKPVEFDACDSSQPGLPGLFAHLVAEFDGMNTRQFDVSLVGAIPTGLGGAFHAAYAVCVLKALHAFEGSERLNHSEAQGEHQSRLRDQATRALDAWYGHRFSPAFVVGCLFEGEGPFVLVDTGTLDHIPVDLPTGTRPGWGIMEWSRDWFPSMMSSSGRFKKAKRALEDLQKNGFEAIGSIRNLEHRDLERALDSVPRRSRPVLKHLVSENRNVQKLVTAIRKGDWQFLGALMMISQASKKADWDTTSALHELVTNKAESASLDGIFGVVQTGEGGCMLVAGQPFSVPAFLDDIRESARTHTREEIETFII